MINEEDVVKVIMSDQGLLATQAGIGTSAKSANASQQSNYLAGLPGEFSETDLHIDDGVAQQRFAMDIT